MLARSLKLFSIRNIRIEIHASWLLLGFLIASSLATGWFPREAPGHSTAVYWIAAVVCAGGLLVSIALHELCHALVGQRFAMPIGRITLFLFGGVAQMDSEPATPKAEFLMAIAGPAGSVVLALFLGILTRLSSAYGTSSLVTATFSYLASINIVVAVFNMLPGFPLDGGRVLRSALWYFKNDLVWATRIAAGIGQFFGFGLMGLGLATFALGSVVSGIWAIVLGGMLIAFARSSYVQVLVKNDLQGKSVASFMNRAPATVRPDTHLSELMRDFVNHSDQSLFPVVEADGALLGCVDPREIAKDVARFPESEWPLHAVSEVTQSFTFDQQTEPTTDAQVALSQMAKKGYSELVVVQGNRLLGILSQAALLRYMSLRHS